MTLYKRKWNCAVCHKPVIYDDVKKTLTCGCKVQPNVTFVNMEAFEPIPKVDSKIWKEELTVPIDCAKFLSTEITLEGSQILFISDRQSIIHGNENPKVHARWIRYPEKGKVQLCLEVSGTFHTEKLTYNQKKPDDWRGRIWIYLSSDQVRKLKEWMEKDPTNLAVWM